jgi:ribosomal protein S21
MTMLLEPKDAAQLTCLRVVHGHELEGLTRRGWKVVETLVETELQSVTEPASDSEMESIKRQYGGYVPQGQTYYDGSMSVPVGMRRRQIPVQVTKFLVGEPLESALEELVSQLEKEGTARGRAEREVADALTLTKKAEEESARLAKSHDVCSKDRDRFHGEVYELQAQKRKLEGDIGKLRVALGDLRMKEILEGSAK